MIDTLHESALSTGEGFPVSSDSIARMTAVLLANLYDDAPVSGAVAASPEEGAALAEAAPDTIAVLGTTATAGAAETGVPLQRPTTSPDTEGRRRARRRRAADGSTSTSGARQSRRGSAAAQRTGEHSEQTADSDAVTVEPIADHAAQLTDDESKAHDTAPIRAIGPEEPLSLLRPAGASTARSRIPGIEGLPLPDEEAEVSDTNHDSIRSTGQAAEQEAPGVSATHFAQLIEAGTVITADIDASTLHDALVLIGIKHRYPGQALAKVLEQVNADATGRVTQAIEAACADIEQLRHNAKLVFWRDLASVEQSIQALTYDDIARAEQLVGRAMRGVIPDADARRAFSERIPYELYERVAIGLRMDSRVAASRVLESTTAQYLMWRWQESTRRPADMVTHTPRPQPQAPAAQHPSAQTEGERARLGDKKRAVQEVTELINQLWGTQRNADLSNVPARYQPAALRRLALNHLGISDQEWTNQYAIAEEVWTVFRALRNGYGGNEEYDAVNKAVQDRLGVSLDELIAASLKRTNGLHANVLTVNQVLEDYTSRYVPRTQPQDLMLQMRTFAGKAWYRIQSLHYGIYEQRQEAARWQPRRLSAQQPLALVKLRDSAVRRAPERRAAPATPVTRTPRPTPLPADQPARPAGMSFLREDDQAGQVQRPETLAASSAQHSIPNGASVPGDDEEWLR